MGNEFAAMLCVESTKLRDGPDFQTCGSSFLANCHLVEPLFVYRFSLAESVVTASTRYYVRGRNLSRRVDKTDKLPQGLDRPRVIPALAAIRTSQVGEVNNCC